MEKIIGIGEYTISNNEEDVLKTLALSSCVAATFYSPAKKVAGLIHIALPAHNGAQEKTYKPGYYATVGIPLIIEKLISDYGCLKSELRVQLFGGANSIRKNDCFNIGVKNIKAIEDILDELRIKVKKTEVGGYMSRSLEMAVSSGEVIVLTQPIKI